MTTEEVEKTLRGLSLVTRPVSEASLIKAVALILAGLHAQNKVLAEVIRNKGSDGYYDGQMEPEAFLGFVADFMLRPEKELPPNPPHPVRRKAKAAKPETNDTISLIKKIGL